MEKPVMIDMMNMVFISYSITKKQLTEDFSEKHVPFFLHFLFSKMNYIFSTYGKLIICWDGKGGLEWRRKIYPLYKKNRDEKKNDEYYILMNTLPRIKEVLNYYPCKQIEVFEAEADDILYTLAKKYNNGIILSTDRDLIQIANKYDVEVYNPIQRKFYEKDPVIIERKCIIGDRSDNIPGIPRIGVKTFEKMLNDKNLFNKKINGENLKLLETFKKIVDLSNIPYEIQQKILDIEKNTKYNKFSPEDIELFFWENSLKELLDKWQTTKEQIMKALKLQSEEV